MNNANGDQVLQASLCTRPDITADAAKNLMPLLPPEGKKRLTWLFQHNKEAAEALVDQAQKDVAKEKLASRKGRIETKILLADFREDKMTLSEAISHLVDGERVSDIVLCIASIADMDEPVVANAFYQVNDEPISILCKSLDVSVDVFTKLMGLRCGKLKLPLSAAGRSVASYKELDISSSQRAMRFVQMRKNLNQG